MGELYGVKMNLNKATLKLERLRHPQKNRNRKSSLSPDPSDKDIRVLRLKQSDVQIRQMTLFTNAMSTVSRGRRPRRPAPRPGAGSEPPA